MKKKVKVIILIALAAVALAAGAAYAMAPLTLDTATLQPSLAELTFTERGVYQYGRLYNLYPPVSGEVLEVRVKEGDEVKAGDVIALISASDYQHQIAQYQSAIEGYNGQLANLSLQEQQEKANLSATLASLKGQFVTLRAERMKNIDTRKSLEGQIKIQQEIIWQNQSNVSGARKDLQDARDYGSDAEISAARQAYTAAQNALAQSELLLEQLKAGDVPDDIYEGQRQSIQSQIDLVSSQLNKSYLAGMRQFYNAQIEAANAGIAQMEEMAGKAEVTAAIGGIIAQLPAYEQNLVSQQAALAVIGSAAEVEVFVPIREIDAVAPGIKVELILDKRLGDETIPGTIMEVENEAQVKLSALGVEERKVRVLIRPEAPGLAVGYDMDVRFPVLTRENALIVPKTAVFTKPDGDYIWVIRDGAAHSIQFTKGPELREGYIVEDGLSEGDIVVVDAGNAALSEGRRAKARPES